MEDYRIDIMIDQGPNARSVRLDIPRFTLVGAPQGLAAFGSHAWQFTLQTRLDYYNHVDLTKIIESCDLLDCPIDGQEPRNRIAGTGYSPNRQ